ncbi:MAG: DUF308 domain-containing protein [archaeon]
MKRPVRILSLVFLGLGIILVLNAFTGLTGFAIVGELAVEASVMIGVAFIVGGIVGLVLSGKVEDTRRRFERGELEKIFFEDEKGNILVNDFKGELNKEGVPYRARASEALEILRKYKGNPDEAEVLQEVLEPYIAAARHQRDSHVGEEIKPNSEVGMADQFLKDWDPNYRPLNGGRVPPIPLDYVGKEYVLVRHYTTRSRADRIEKEGKLGGEGSPKNLDQGRIFLEPASSPVLSQQEFVEKYALSNSHLGEAYVEFLVPADMLEDQINPRHGKKEHYIKATESEKGVPVYRIRSETKKVRKR